MPIKPCAIYSLDHESFREPMNSFGERFLGVKFSWQVLLMPDVNAVNGHEMVARWAGFVNRLVPLLKPRMDTRMRDHWHRFKRGDCPELVGWLVCEYDSDDSEYDLDDGYAMV